MSKQGLTIVIAVLVVVIAFGVYLFYQKKPSGVAKPSQTPQPTLSINTPAPTNPLGGVKTNPFEGVKFNPFK